MPEKKLTPKEKRFVSEYLLDLNGTQAAKRASYSAATARQAAARLLSKVYIQDAIAAAMAARATDLDIDTAWVLKRLLDEAQADIADIYDEEGNLLHPTKWPKIFRTGLVAGMEIHELENGGKKLGVAKKVKLSDRHARVVLLGKHLGLFEDKLKIDGNLTVDDGIDYSKLSTAALKEIAAARRKTDD